MEFVLHVGEFSRYAYIAWCLGSPVLGQRDRELLDSLALLFVALERDGSVEFGEGVDGVGSVGVEGTFEVVFHVSLVGVERLFTLLAQEFSPALTLLFLTFLGCIGVASLLYLIGNGGGLGRVHGILHARELGAYLVEEFGDGRAVGVHLLHRVASLVDVGGTLHVEFVAHALLLDLGEEALAVVGAFLA